MLALLNPRFSKSAISEAPFSPVPSLRTKPPAKHYASAPVLPSLAKISPRSHPLRQIYAPAILANKRVGYSFPRSVRITFSSLLMILGARRPSTKTRVATSRTVSFFPNRCSTFSFSNWRSMLALLNPRFKTLPLSPLFSALTKCIKTKDFYLL